MTDSTRITAKKWDSAVGRVHRDDTALAFKAGAVAE
jgi:hypothetical protein